MPAYQLINDELSLHHVFGSNAIWVLELPLSAHAGTWLVKTAITIVLSAGAMLRHKELPANRVSSREFINNAS